MGVGSTRPLGRRCRSAALRFSEFRVSFFFFSFFFILVFAAQRQEQVVRERGKGLAKRIFIGGILSFRMRHLLSSYF